MEPIPKDVLIQFDDILKQRNVPLSSHADYRKWPRYFLDYRAKYSPPDAKSDQVRLFAEKAAVKESNCEATVNVACSSENAAINECRVRLRVKMVSADS